MNVFKRLTSCIQAQFDSLVSKMENHDAVVAAAIREVEESAAKAHVSLKRMQRDRSQMAGRVASLEGDIIRWKERAKELALHDEAKALECLKRSKQAEQDLKLSKKQLEEQHVLEIQLTGDISKIQDKLRILKTQRNILKTREHRAQALHTIGQDESSQLLELGDIIERWEAKVLAHEIGAELSLGRADTLTEEFLTAEEAKSLKDELTELINKN